MVISFHSLRLLALAEQALARLNGAPALSANAALHAQAGDPTSARFLSGTRLSDEVRANLPPDHPSITASQLVGPGLGAAWKVVATADYNGDAKADILWRNDSTGDVFMQWALSRTQLGQRQREAESRSAAIGVTSGPGLGTSPGLSPGSRPHPESH